METIKYLNWGTINKYVKDKLIKINKHPNKDLWILKYTIDTQYEDSWDTITLSCRGLVVDKDCNIVGRSFTKFFNKEEHECKPEILPKIPYDLPYEVFEKYDGSLGILFWHENEWVFTTSGSFVSEQAIIGNNFLDKYNIDELQKEHTYLFEIIYPENIIVVDYHGEKKLVLLAVKETKTGEDMSYDTMFKTCGTVFPIAKRYDGINDLNKLKETEKDNKEGYVIRFSDGFRMKIKFNEYVRLHAIITKVSKKLIWKSLQDGKSLQPILDVAPDELFNWINETKEDLESKFEVIKKEVEIEYESIIKSLDPGFTKKDFALIAKESKHKLFMFRKYNKQGNNNSRIWRQLKPKGGFSQFKTHIGIH